MTTHDTELAQIEAQKAALDEKAAKLRAEAAAQADQDRRRRVEEATRNGEAELSALFDEIEAAQNSLQEAMDVLRERAAAWEALRAKHKQVYRRVSREIGTAVTREEFRAALGVFEKFPSMAVALCVDQPSRDARDYSFWIQELLHTPDVRRAERADHLVVVMRRGGKPYRLINGENK